MKDPDDLITCSCKAAIPCEFCGGLGRVDDGKESMRNLKEVCANCNGKGTLNPFYMALEKWGYKIQMLVAIEECAELQKALVKFRRKHPQAVFVGSEQLDGAAEILEEIADVEIMLNQLKEVIVFGSKDKTTKEWYSEILKKKFARFAKLVLEA